MNKEELINKLVDELKVVPSLKTGGQVCGFDTSIRVEHPEVTFELKISEYRSQIRNFELAKDIFRFYLEKTIKDE